MSQIGKYPIVPDVRSSDRALVWRSSEGKTVQIPISVFEAILPTNFLELTDTPGTFVGQQGKTLAVNNTEDALEFVPNNLSPSFITLPDTPASYGTAAGKTLRVNSLENAVEFADSTFLNEADTPSSYAGKAGYQVVVNATEDGLEFELESTTPGIVVVLSEDDLPALNGSGEHPLAENTSYFFPKSVTIANPLRIEYTSTEILGQGIGISKVTYTGSGYAIRATNGAASIRLRYIQFISATGDGFEFIGGGSGSSTNCSFDRAYVICPSGKIGTVTSVDIFFAEAAVMLGSQGLSFAGANNDLFYMGTSRFQAAGVTNLIDFGTSVWQIITTIVIDFRGTAGATALAGAASSANVAVNGSAQFANCTVEAGIIALSGITTEDTKWRFSGNVGIDDSNTIAMGYITTPATTNVTDGVDVPIDGTWTDQANTERATVSSAGVISFLNVEQEKGLINATFTASKLGGGTGTYTFKVQKDPNGAGWTDVEGVSKTVTLTAGTTSSITLMGIAKYKDNDDFRIVVRGVGTSDDIDVNVTQFVIGS